MTIQTSELKFYKSAIVADTTANGGRIAAAEAATGVKNNVWPDVPQTERVAGSTKYRKTFLKVANASGLALYSAQLFVETPTPGGDRVIFHPGTNTDTQGTMTTTGQWYGAGALNADISSGATTIVVATEGGSADAIFANGVLIRVSNKATVDASSGTEEFVYLASSNAVSWNGTLATLTLSTPLANAYQAYNTRVASVWEIGTIAPAVDTWARSTAAGVYAGWSGGGSTPSIVIPNAIGGIEQTWTITFSSATVFSVVGDTVGAVGTGNTSTDLSPNNSDFSVPYFTMPASGWSGTWANGDVISFKTHPAAAAFWQKRIIPANTASLAGDKVIFGVSGESA